MAWEGASPASPQKLFVKLLPVNPRHDISLFSLLFFAGATLVMCFALPAGAQQYSYKLYTVDDGLPTNAVYGGLQDSRGYIWFYTEKGISRFDGYSFRNFTVRDGLPTNDIFMLTEDSGGRLWPHSFSRRLVRIVGDSIHTVAEDQAPRFHSFSVFNDGKRVWFKDLNRRRLIAENGPGFDTIRYHQAKGPEEQQSSDNDGTYPYKWNVFLRVRARTGQCRLINSTGAVLDTFMIPGMDIALAKKLAARLHNSFFTFGGGLLIQPYSDSILYHLGLEGEKRITRFNLVDIFGSQPDLIRYYELDGQLQVQSNLGAFILGQGLNILDVFKPKLPPSIRLDRIFQDREGNFWLCSKQKGVFFLTAEERNATVLTNPAGMEDHAITCLAGDGKGALYAGTRRGSVYRVTAGKGLEPLLFAPPSRYNDVVEVKAMAVDDEDKLWIGRQSLGLEQYSPSSGRTRHFSRWIEQANIQYGSHEEAFYRDFDPKVLSLYVKGLTWNSHQKQLAVGRAHYPFLLSMDEQGKTNIQLISSQRTHAIVFGRQDSVWLGHQDGLAVYCRGHYQHLGEEVGIPEGNIWDMEIDGQGVIWAGTDGYGLFAFDGKKAVPVSGTEDDIIQDVFIGPLGWAWIATNRGVKGITIAAPPERSRVVQILTTNSGLATNEANAVYADSCFIYAGTNEGLAIVDRALPFRDSTPPLLILDEIRINGAIVPLQQRYELAHHQNEIEAFFTGISYKSFGNITYEYQMANADKGPQHTHIRQARYTGLQPGNYTFQARAIDIKGVESPPLPPIAFTIHPPWWQSRLAIITWILLSGALLLGIYRARVNAVRRKAMRDTAINKRFAELELQALQSQMNPHFVFNSLGAIQYFIQANDQKQADRYLSKFAYLMRLFLESSKNKFISLAEELKLIQLYVELEQLRFKGKFGFEMEVDGQVDPHTTLLPSMLLQPFVENAINHGFFHKDGEGRLKLAVSQMSNGRLKFVIEDDGIGRERAMEIRMQSDKNYKSRALQIITERLQALQEVEGYHIAINIEDLFDEGGRPQGTKVNIEIPEIE